jgi:hypothetical protein
VNTFKTSTTSGLQDGRRHFSQQSLAQLLHPDGRPQLTNPLTGGIAA